MRQLTLFLLLLLTAESYSQEAKRDYFNEAIQLLIESEIKQFNEGICFETELSQEQAKALFEGAQNIQSKNDLPQFKTWDYISKESWEAARDCKSVAVSLRFIRVLRNNRLETLDELVFTGISGCNEIFNEND